MDKIIENLSQIVDVLKSHFLNIGLAFAAFGWLTLVLPQSVFEYLGVAGLRDKQREILGAIAFVSTYLVVLWVAYRGLVLAFGYARALYELPRLSGEERQRLNKFVGRREHTATFYLADGVVAQLESKGLIYKSSAKANPREEQDYHMYTWVFRRLEEQARVVSDKERQKA